MKLWKNSSAPARPRTGQSTIRGKPISNPIPIPSPLDDEFPMRNPGTSVATSQVGPRDSDRQLAPPPPGGSTVSAAHGQEPEITVPPQQEPMQMPMPMPTQPEREAPAVPPPPESMSREYHSRGQSFSATLPRPSTSPPRPGNSPPRHESSPPRPRDSPPRRTNVHSSARYSTASAASTGQTGHSRDTPQRKKSTLRTALGRLFGRKKKTSSTGGSTDETLAHMQMRNNSQHRSSTLPAKDPTALTNRPIDRDRVSEPKRSASLPITEFDRALRSHSIGPDDITAIESARNSIQADPGTGRRRAATTTSRLLQTQRTDGWGGLSPRPASTHGRGSRLISAMELEGAGVEHDPEEIGRAITSDIGSRRRSRSLSGLEDIENQRGDAVRKRSDEIRYWRESYDPGFLSPLSSNVAETENDGEREGEGDHPDTSGHDESTDREASTAVPEISAAVPPHLDLGSSSHQARTPPQPFTFPGTVASMNEMAGMKITHAASIETRIHSLENRMHTLERVVSELYHNAPSYSAPVDSPGYQRPSTAGAPGGPGLGIAISDDQQPASSFTTATTSVPLIPAIYSTTDSGSHMSFGDAPTFTESMPAHPAGTSVPPMPSSFLHTSSRPTSNATVRGATSLPQLHMPRTNEERDGYASLIALITAEQSARMALEAKVRTLSHRVDILSASSGNYDCSNNPTPQRVHLPVHQQDIPGTAKSLGTFSAFDEDSDSDEDDGQGNLRREDTVVDVTVDDDASYSEAFETPREEITPAASYGYGAFGEELREAGDGSRKAARTLSLSQLTLGKAQQAQAAAGGGDIPDVPATPTAPGVHHGVNF